MPSNESTVGILTSACGLSMHPWPKKIRPRCERGGKGLCQFRLFFAEKPLKHVRVQNPQSPPDQVSQSAKGLSENEALSLDIVLVADLDREAFRRLYARTANKLFAICLAVTRDHAAAEDVLQESYLKIWDRAKGYDPERSRPLAWMGAIARNAAIDWYRARARHHHVGDEHLNLQESEAAAADDRIIAMNREDLVWTAVGNLDAESEQELKSIYLLGLTYPEAAQRLNLPVATFKSRVRRTVLRIRRKLADD